MIILDVISDEVFEKYKLTLDSYLLDLKDFWDPIYFIIKCEELYEFQLFDDEVVFMEKENLSFRQIDEFIKFLKTGIASDYIQKSIIKNIKELKDIRPIYIEYIRNNRINSLFE
jgi:hypothetical protein